MISLKLGAHIWDFRYINMAALFLNNVLYILQSAIYREAIHNEIVLHRKGLQ